AEDGIRVRNVTGVQTCALPISTDNEEQVDVSLIVVAGDEPMCFQEAVESEESNLWWKAMEEEFIALIRNKTWKMVPLPPSAKLEIGRASGRERVQIR